MVWEPSIRVTDIRPISPNLLQFFRDHQTETLFWANGNQAGLSDFAVIYNTGEGLEYQIFPNVQVIRERHSTSYDDGGLTIKYSLDLLYEVYGTNPTDLRIEAKKRGYALESMAVNIPADELIDGIDNITTLTVNEVTLEHGLLQGEEGKWVIGSTLRLAYEFME